MDQCFRLLIIIGKPTNWSTENRGFVRDHQKIFLTISTVYHGHSLYRTFYLVGFNGGKFSDFDCSIIKSVCFSAKQIRLGELKQGKTHGLAYSDCSESTKIFFEENIYKHMFSSYTQRIKQILCMINVSSISLSIGY